MIERFFPPRRIKATRENFKVLCESCTHRLNLTSSKRAHEIDETVLHIVTAVAIDDLAAEQRPDFAVRDDERGFLPKIHILDPFRREIARRDKHCVEGVLILVDFVIDDALIYHCRDWPPLQDIFHLIERLVLRMAQHLAEDGVSRSVHPVSTCLAVVMEIIDDRPRIVDLPPCKTIAVIPIPELLHLFLAAEVPRHLRDVLWREAERFRIPRLEHTVHFEIIQRGKNILLRNAQHACQHGKIERGIRLQRGREKFAEEIERFVIILMLPCRLDRDVVLIE